MVDNNEVFSNPDNFHAKLQALADSATPEVTKEPEIEQKNDETTQEAPIREEQESAETELVEPSDSTEVEASGDSGEDDYKSKKFIPKSRFNQEIEKRKSLEEQLLREREDRIRFEEQAKMYSHLQQQQNAPYQAPEPDLDGVDALDSETHQVYSREIKQLKEQLRNTTHQQRQMQYANLVATQENTFIRENPDYLKAANYLKDIEINAGKEMFGDEQAAHQLVMQKYQQLMTKAIETGKSVPETIYKLAKTYGYKGEEEVTPSSKGGSNLKAINANMKKSASISGLGNSVGIGSTKPKDITSALKDPSNPRSGFDPKKFQQLLHKAG